MLIAPPVLFCLLAEPSRAPSQARTNLDAGRYLQVLAEANAELNANPGSASAWAAKSQALTALLRFREAEEAAGKALSLKGDLADAVLARGMAKAATAVQQRNFSSLKKAAAAMDDFRRATELDPTLIAAWNSLGLAYQQLPGILGGSTRQALRCADQLTRVSPARGNLLKGMVLALDERWREAEPLLRRALELAPQDPQVVYGYLDALGQSATRETLGQEAWQQRSAQEARRLWPGVKGSARGLQAVTDALLDAGEGEEAWKLAKGVVGSTDSPSLVRFQLGKVAARAGVHREEGLFMLDQVLKEPLEGGTGGYASVHWRRGQILRDLGRMDEARQAAQAGLALDPRHPGSRKLLSELQVR
ncbi:MAG: tetratricopeptide repeat protein [Holophagaceae bacterium]|nr:tetratricopeptide repeat protein [Holophagaceae bacterium]